MSKPIHLANVTVEELFKGKPKRTTFYKVSFVDGSETYKNKKIVSVEKLSILGKTNY